MEDYVDHHVVVVDFSFKRSVLETMADHARSVLVLDHHKTAKEDLEGLPVPPSSFWSWIAVQQGSPLSRRLRLAALFDMERSGAGITWDFFQAGPRPWLLNHVEDRDLWRFKLPNTREICASLFSHDYNFETWTALMYDVLERNSMIREGAAIMRKQLKDTDELIESTLQWFVIDGREAPVLNVPYQMGSEACHRLLERFEQAQLAAYYLDKPNGRYWGFRSREGTTYAADAARVYGGGGHATAAGATIPYDATVRPKRVGEG